MTIAYFDCFSGVSGDMVLGSLVDAGMPLARLKSELKKLPLRSYELVPVRAGRGIRGTNIRVEVSEEPRADDYGSLDKTIADSRLPKQVKEVARAIFARLARAEAAVHGMPLERVHFHEVGAVDSIVDVVGAAIGFDFFGFGEIHASPLPMSRGRVECMHGTLPVPAPATLEILKGIPLERSPVKGEIVTPTGAAILVTAASHFGECPIQSVERVGYGFGDRVIPGIPNALRLIIGEGFPVVVIETDIDDMSPELFEEAVAKVFAAGAVDVHLEPIQMKKGRPGVKLVAISPWSAKEATIGAILRETTSFGVRYWPAERKVLLRELVKEKIGLGGLSFKVGRDASGQIIKAMPEFEDVKKLARKKKRPLAEVYQEALAHANAITIRGRKSGR